jgi:methylmalonyl-CoA mutase N-terminal domain/subunit
MKKVYCAPPPGLDARLGKPGEFPFTRGVYPEMYSSGRLWTMRQYAGFGSARESNERYRYLLEQGVSGLSVAFDLPTQLGLDPDDPLAVGEVGRVGVSIATVDDMRQLFSGIPLGKVTTSMTINAPAMMLLAFYLLLAEEQGVAFAELGGTVQNDILKEYIARGTYIYPTEASMRLITDMFAFCRTNVPNWNTISISGYHIREAGSTAAQELAFTLANARSYVRAALAAGLGIDEFAPRLSFFFACHNDIFEEAAKFRAARRMWAVMMRDEFGAQEARSQLLRFHTQTGGSTLTAQQVDNNIVRTAYQALAAVLGGTQSLHTNAADEALGLPTPDTARTALRTQQILAFESGVPNAVDPLAGSYFVEHLTDGLEREARSYLERIEELGGSISAIEAGYIQNEIEDAAYDFQRDIEEQRRIVVGVNRFQEEAGPSVPIQQIDPQLERQRVSEIRAFRAQRDQQAADTSLSALRQASRGSSNLFPFVLDAFRARATLGEVCGVLRQEWGEYR